MSLYKTSQKTPNCIENFFKSFLKKEDLKPKKSIDKTMDTDFINPLNNWTKGKQPLPKRFYTNNFKDIVNEEEWTVWLSTQEVNPFYKVNDMKWKSLKDSINETNQYLEKADALINGLSGGSLDSEEQIFVKELGPPPIPSLPIYIITCVDKKNIERIVYIGITKTTSRFSGGHSSAIKLHNPKYDNELKKIYRSTLWFHIDDEYINLDWIKPEKLALELIDNIESQLIYHFKPELNTKKKENNVAKWDFEIIVENHLNGFLHYKDL